MINFTPVLNYFIRNPNLTVEEKAIINCLLSLNPCHPSIKDIMEWTGLSRMTISKYKKLLRAQKVINWTPGHSHGKNNEYYIELNSTLHVLLPIEQKKAQKYTRWLSKVHQVAIKSTPSTTPIIPINNILDTVQSTSICSNAIEVVAEPTAKASVPVVEVIDNGIDTVSKTTISKSTSSVLLESSVIKSTEGLGTPALQPHQIKAKKLLDRIELLSPRERNEVNCVYKTNDLGSLGTHSDRLIRQINDLYRTFELKLNGKAIRA